MGILENPDSKARLRLLPHTLIGRGREHHVALDDESVSCPHATLRWEPAGWILRDLGSRNGSYVDGQRLEAGERRPLSVGCEVRFGETVFTFADSAPPSLLARSLTTGELRAPEAGLLALPSSDDPQLTVYEGPDGVFRCERDDRVQDLTDLAVLDIDGDRWEVSLPGSAEATWEVTRPPPAIETIGLRFRVSSDEEHVELTIRPRGDETEVPPRSFHYLLLTLARARLKGSDCAASEQGWVEREALCKMLRTDPTKLNVDVFRARRQLGELGVLGAANLVERRGATRALRLGVQDLEVRRLR